MAPELEIHARRLPRLFFDRGAEAVTRRSMGRDKAWLTKDAIVLLSQLLKDTDHVLEFGAGRSTTWFAGMVDHVTSVEDSSEWAEFVRVGAAQQGFTNIDIHVVAATTNGIDSPEHRDAYVNVAGHLEPESLGMVLVDGHYRDACALRGVDLVHSGGLLVLDNAETYLPSSTRSPWGIPAPATVGWAEFLEKVAAWRCIWTTNGVWDTVIWIKP